MNSTNNSKMKNKDWVILAWIILLGLCLRTIYLWQLIDAPDFIALRQDLDVQDYQARAMLSGDWTVREGVSDPHIPTTPYYRPPGYPYFLAVVYWLFDGSYLAPRLIHMVLGLIHIVLIYYLAKIVFNRRTALCSSFFVSTYWAFIYYEGEVNDPALFVFFVPCILLLLYFGIFKSTPVLSFFAGLLIGIYAIMRPNILSFVPFIILWILFISYRIELFKKSVLHISLLFIAIFTIIVPVTIRNYLVSNEFVPISTYFGENLLIGNSEDADGITPWLPYLQELEGTGNWSVWHYDNVVKGLGKELGREVTHSEASNIFAKMAINYVISHPKETLILTIKKAILFWSPQEITENKVVEGEKQHYTPLKYLPGFPLVLSSALFGIFHLCLKQYRNKERQQIANYPLLILIILFIMSYYFSFLPFFVNARARVPILGVMLIFGGYGISETISYIQQKRLKIWCIQVIILILLFILFHINIIPYKPDMCRWHYDRADSFLRVGRIDEALGETYALMKRPEQPMNYMPFRLGHAFAKLGYTELAINLLRLALSVNPPEQNPMFREDLHYHIGAQLLKLKKYDEAIKDFKEALEINPQDPRVHNDLGIIFRDLGNYNQSEKHFLEAIRIEPKFNLAIINLTDLFIKEQKYNDAISLLEHSLKLKPNDTELLYNLGFTYHCSGNLERALLYYDNVLSIKNNEPATLNNKAMIYWNTGQKDQAVRTLKLCIDNAPYFTLGYANLGDILYSDNQKNEAFYYYDKGLETNSQHIGLRIALSFLYLEIGKKEQGEIELKDAINTNPSSVELWTALGNYYKEIQLYDKAEKAYKKAIELDKLNLHEYINLIELYILMKDVKKAEETFKQAKEMNPDSEELKYLLEKIHGNK